MKYAIKQNNFIILIFYTFFIIILLMDTLKINGFAI